MRILNQGINNDKYPWTYVKEDLNGKEIVERICKKNCKRKIKQGLEFKK